MRFLDIRKWILGSVCTMLVVLTLTMNISIAATNGTSVQNYKMQSNFAQRVASGELVEIKPGDKDYGFGYLTATKKSKNAHSASLLSER